MNSTFGAIRRVQPTLLSIIVVFMCVACVAQRVVPHHTMTISVFGTNDVHGELLPKHDRGGLVTISAYVDALRAARSTDQGAVLVVDAGDMWQGTLESNLVEGAAMVEAYNAIGFTAATIGNHEFDFGPVGSKAIPDNATDDPRGALKQRAIEAEFPMLAANLIDETTGRAVVWDNVRPSIIVDVDGINVGIIGVMSERALLATISANTKGLRIAPLVETISKEAKTLRGQGATVIIVSAHAGSRCANFDHPADTSSCNMDGEIMRVATALPSGLVDHIIAGHVHQGIAHIVNGVSITSSYSNTRAFSRVDLKVDRNSGNVVARDVYPPHWTCLSVVRSTGDCASPGDDPATIEIASYEGRELVPSAEVIDIAARAAAFAQEIKEEKLGVFLEANFEHEPGTESALANLMTDAILESLGSDIAIHNVNGGIRGSLPQGELVFGDVYEMFPFDNRVVLFELTGSQLRQIMAKQVHRHGRRVGFSGMRVFVGCSNDKIDVAMRRSNGTIIRDDDRVQVAANDYLALGGDAILTPVIPAGSFDIDDSMPLTRDVLLQWFRNGHNMLNPKDFQSADAPKWNQPDSIPESCTF